MKSFIFPELDDYASFEKLNPWLLQKNNNLSTTYPVSLFGRFLAFLENMNFTWAEMKRSSWFQVVSSWQVHQEIDFHQMFNFVFRESSQIF